MNKWIGMGRITRDPEVRYSQSDNSMAIARYTLAVDRRGKSAEGQQTADFISIVAFGKAAEFAEKYFRKGTKLVVTGRIQTGSYKKDGQTVYTTEVVAEDQEFAESKGSGSVQNEAPREMSPSDGFINIPEGVDEDLPFAQPTR